MHLHVAGEEVLMDLFAGERSQPPDPWYVGLYHDGVVSGQTREGDRLADSARHADITTEPDYDGPVEVRWPEDVHTESVSGSDLNQTGDDLWVTDITAAIEYDITDVAADSVVDAYYVAADFRSERLTQATDRRNLLWSGGLDRAYNLAEDDNDVFPLEGVRVGLD